MSGQVDVTPAHVRVVYRDRWTHDDAERLIAEPMANDMHRACEEIAKRYSSTDITITVV
jgi:hypothetical protein